MYAVVMIEPAHPGEKLKVSEQINEVFGPFDSDKEATDWTTRASHLIKNREWLIIPFSSPNIDPKRVGRSV